MKLALAALAALALTMAAQGQTPCALNDKPIDCAKLGASNITSCNKGKCVTENPSPQQKEPPNVWQMNNRQYPVLILHDSGRVEMHTASGAKLMDCKGVNGKPAQCVIAPGHTLDEVMQVWAASLQGGK